jgi:adenosine deaminase/adenosine deaminase CECR1
LCLNATLAVIYFVFLSARPPASPPLKVAVPAHSHAFAAPTPPHTIDAYFEKIRTSRAALTAFFSQMPKGGDLHNHLTGSIYAESFLDLAIAQKLWVNRKTLALSAREPAVNNGSPTASGNGPANTDYVRIDTFCTKPDYPALKQRLIQDWSAKDFYPGLAAPDQHFFDAFGKFPSLTSWDDIHHALMQLKQRALAENVQYLEVMIGSAPSNFPVAPAEQYNTVLRTEAAAKDTNSLYQTLQELYNTMQTDAAKNAQTFSDELSAMHHQGLDDAAFTMRYQLALRRENSPLGIFKALMASFKAADLNPLIGGINFVNREDGELSMQDYYLHMLLFHFMHRKFPAVPFSLHAGELTLGLVKPEDLTWHIHDAVYVAGANRIGHGVDMAYEQNSRSLLQYMSRNRTAIEINLSSNEFILGVRDDAHPILLYAANKVPIVISTDDPGVLRTNLTQQFVLLAMRYRQLRYADIRQFVLNSIEYSFIRDARLKEKIKTDLNKRLEEFEKEVVM